MDPLTKLHYTHITQSLSPIKSPPTPRLHSSHTSFPIIAVAIIGILATAFLLVSYYIFVIKCCLNWHRIDLLRRFSFSRNRHRHEGSLVTFSPPLENRGLEESVIRSIPILNYQELAERNQLECSVCLNEFQKEEKLRIIPNCNHFFHIDCIDVWLQSNSNCPLCRRSISIESTQFPLPSQDISASPCNDDEGYVVIELGDEQNNGHHSGDVLVQPRDISPSPRKVEQNTVVKKGERFSHVLSMGDECIDIRGKDERFSVQPLRRSFSMNSADDRQLYLAVQEIVQGKNRPLNEVSSSEDFSSRMRRSFFPFGHGRGSRNAVLPIHLDP